MSWIEKLHQTYEACVDAPQFEKDPPLPVGYTEQQAHIEIVVDQSGNFQRAAVVPNETTMFPATEDSAGRTSKPVPHPICDKIQYCAADYGTFGGEKESFFEAYIKQLREWHTGYPNDKVGAVLHYVAKGTVVADLVRSGVLHCGADHKLLTEWASDAPMPAIFKVLTAKEKKRDQGAAFVRWRVQVHGDPVSAIWLDPGVRDSWIRFEASRNQTRGLCMVTGETTDLAVNHPKRLRNAGDRAKLISSNDRKGYTFRGRFASSEEACSVGAVVSQKAHNALRWLTKRQGSAGNQVFVAWAVSGQSIPDPLASTAELFGALAVSEAPEPAAPYQGDAGQHYALRLRKAISGYRAILGDAEGVVVIGLDSATPGRMAITYYRELTGSEFLERVGDWHARCSWFQRYSKDNQFVGAPAPREIAEAAYGRRLDDKLRRSIVERLLPCIVDGRPLPRDLVAAGVRRASNRAGMKNWDWEKYLGIACALVRGSIREENYQMSLEEDRTTRDYLFGRLLAIAENIEDRALHLAREKRDTNAGRLMQRFADHPCSTWRNIELALAPYKTRLRTNRPAVLLERDKLLDAVIGMFSEEDFISDRSLSGEFLLGYHCQREALWPKGKPGAASPDKDESTIEEEI